MTHSPAPDVESGDWATDWRLEGTSVHAFHATELLSSFFLRSSSCVPSCHTRWDTCHFHSFARSSEIPFLTLGQKIGFALIGWSAEKGSRLCVYAAKGGKDTHGCDLSEGRITRESEYMQSNRGQEAQRRVWRDLMSHIQNISPDIAKNVI